MRIILLVAVLFLCGCRPQQIEIYSLVDQPHDGGVAICTTATLPELILEAEMRDGSRWNYYHDRGTCHGWIRVVGKGDL